MKRKREESDGSGSDSALVVHLKAFSRILDTWKDRIEKKVDHANSIIDDNDTRKERFEQSFLQDVIPTNLEPPRKKRKVDNKEKMIQTERPYWKDFGNQVDHSMIGMESKGIQSTVQTQSTGLMTESQYTNIIHQNIIQPPPVFLGGSVGNVREKGEEEEEDDEDDEDEDEDEEDDDDEEEEDGDEEEEDDDGEDDEGEEEEEEEEDDDDDEEEEDEGDGEAEPIVEEENIKQQPCTTSGRRLPKCKTCGKSLRGHPRKGRSLYHPEVVDEKEKVEIGTSVITKENNEDLESSFEKGDEKKILDDDDDNYDLMDEDQPYDVFANQPLIDSYESKVAHFQKLNNSSAYDSPPKSSELKEDKLEDLVSDEECKICLEDSVNDSFFTLECGHKFHVKCLHNSLASRSIQKKCFSCQVPISERVVKEVNRLVYG